jgi:hypothetical protein
MMRKRMIGTAAGFAALAVLLGGDAVAKKGEPGIVLTIYNPSAVTSTYQQQYGYNQYQYQRYGYQQPYQYGQTAVDPAGYAVVTERRKITVPNGGGEVRFPDVPAQIDPTTVQFTDETDPAAEVTQQRFEHDLANVDALLARYVGQAITVVTDQGERTGTLLWYDANQFLLKTDDAKTPMQIIDRGKSLRDVRFGNLTGGITAQPTLIWQLASKKAGEHLAQVTYQTRGISWSADYNVVMSSDEKKYDVSGWLSIANISGAKFANATLRLIAGDVARDTGQVNPYQYPQYDQYGNPVYNTTPPKAPPIYEFDIPETATIDNGGTKQVEIFGSSSPAVSRTVVYDYLPRQVTYLQGQYGAPTYPLTDPNADGYGAKSTGQLETHLEVTSDKGKALPPGRVRIYKKNDTTGTLELVSETKVDATAKDATLRVKTGTTNDLSAERRQADWQLDETAREAREKFEIKFKNTRKEAVEVLVVEHLYRWGNWTIENESSPSTVGANNTAQFRVKIPANGSQTLTYTAVYNW